MTAKQELITDERLVLKAAQSIWATNKYFILACSQNDYRQIRECLKPLKLNLNLAYQIMERNQLRFQTTPTHFLPEIENALYHMAGYFKNFLDKEQKAALNKLIQQNTEEALRLLKQYANDFQVDYLLHSNIWTGNRLETFNTVKETLKDRNSTYKANELTWYGAYCIVNHFST